MSIISTFISVSLLLTFNVFANSIIIELPGDGNTLNIVQDGVDNNINLDTSNFEDGDMEVEQYGNNNSVGLSITGGTGTGSSFYIYQNGNNNTYSGSLYCGAEWCSMTVTQP